MCITFLHANQVVLQVLILMTSQYTTRSSSCRVVILSNFPIGKKSNNHVGYLHWIGTFAEIEFSSRLLFVCTNSVLIYTSICFGYTCYSWIHTSSIISELHALVYYCKSLSYHHSLCDILMVKISTRNVISGFRIRWNTAREM